MMTMARPDGPLRRGAAMWSAAVTAWIDPRIGEMGVVYTAMSTARGAARRASLPRPDLAIDPVVREQFAPRRSRAPASATATS